MVTNYDTIDGRIIAETTGGVRTSYLPDALGSVTATVQDGAIVNTYRYKPYGAQLAKTGAGADPKFLWNGQHGYRQTGVGIADTYIRARHYARQAGQWLSPDPLWPQEHPYSYRGPVTEVDPLGTQATSSQSDTSSGGPLPSQVQQKHGIPTVTGCGPTNNKKAQQRVDMLCGGLGNSETLDCIVKCMGTCTTYFTVPQPDRSPFAKCIKDWCSQGTITCVPNCVNSNSCFEAPSLRGRPKCAISICPENWTLPGCAGKQDNDAKWLVALLHELGHCCANYATFSTTPGEPSFPGHQSLDEIAICVTKECFGKRFPPGSVATGLGVPYPKGGLSTK